MCELWGLAEGVGMLHRWAVVGSWRIDWQDLDGEKVSWLVNLNDDGSACMRRHSQNAFCTVCRTIRVFYPRWKLS